LDGLHEEISGARSMVVAVKASVGEGLRDRLDQLEIDLKKVANLNFGGSMEEHVSTLKRRIKELASKNNERFDELDSEVGRISANLMRLSQNVSNKLNEHFDYVEDLETSLRERYSYSVHNLSFIPSFNFLSHFPA
jgi:predicted nuclease with TOPRIM domain